MKSKNISQNHFGIQAQCYDLYTFDYDEDLDFFRSLVSVEQHVLELGAGTGRVGIQLIPLCQTYTAIDASPDMIRIFKQKFNDLMSAKPVQFLVQKMENIDLNRKFDLIICPFRSFLHLNKTEKIQLLTSIERHISYRGKFVLAYYPFTIEHSKKWHEKYFDWEFTDMENNAWIKRDHMRFFDSELKFERTVEFYKNGSLQSTHDESLYWISDEDFLKMVNATSLKIIEKRIGFPTKNGTVGHDVVWTLAK